MSAHRFATVVGALLFTGCMPSTELHDDAASTPVEIDAEFAAQSDATMDARASSGDLTGATADDPHDAGLADGATLIGTMELTYYWVTYESDFTGADDTALCDVNAHVLATVPLAFAKAIELEGTGRLADNRLLNVGGSCSCSSGMTVCYVVLDPSRYPWGVGAGSRSLVPFRSIAVDRTRVPLGSKIYVPQFDGVQMPSSYGFVHDGCLSADDTGGGIRGNHIDFFTGQKGNYLILDGMLNLSSVTAYLDQSRCH